jgi:hypothetical protein
MAGSIIGLAWRISQLATSSAGVFLAGVSISAAVSYNIISYLA